MHVVIGIVAVGHAQPRIIAIGSEGVTVMFAVHEHLVAGDEKATVGDEGGVVQMMS